MNICGMCDPESGSWELCLDHQLMVEAEEQDMGARMRQGIAREEAQAN